MSNKLYISNLDYATGEAVLRQAFEPFGQLCSVGVLTGKSRGFGFVEYVSPHDALRASQLLDGHDVDGRRISIRVDRERRAG
jgi:RNA recognition motif-containing protein